MSLAADKTESSAQGRIPVLDIGAYLAGEAGAAAPLARAIARTCEDTGFLVVANHGVPQPLVDDTFAVAQRFFARPEADKRALKVGRYNIGYTGAMLARDSNDRFRATPHRVINRNDRSRHACPFFLGPNHDVVVEPVPSCVGPDNPPRYEPTTYGAFTEALLTLNFAHRQAGGSGEYAG